MLKNNYSTQNKKATQLEWPCCFIRRLEMTYSHMGISATRLSCLNLRRKKARCISNGLITTLASKFGAWK
jgi:hypothetical protein